MELFAPEEFFEVDQSPVDETKIAYTPLYLSTDELKEFKELCKDGMRKEYPPHLLNKEANISDFIMLVLRRLYGKNNSAPQN